MTKKITVALVFTLILMILPTIPATAAELPAGDSPMLMAESTTPGGIISDSDIIYIPDAAFREQICRAMGKPFDADITRAEAGSISILDIDILNVTDITGIEFFIGLTSLQLTPSRYQYVNIDLSPLTKARFPSLESLFIACCNIGDMNSFTNADFPNLKYLYLSECNISDISPLTTVNFPKLDLLDLHMNKISDISPLAYVNFPMLTRLSILGLEGGVNDISPLVNVNFPMLTLLYIGGNFNDISPLAKVNFPMLTALLIHSYFNDISPLAEANFPDLNHLRLISFTRSDFYYFTELDFPKLQHLEINFPTLNTIDFLFEFDFPNLTSLKLLGNIRDISPLTEVNFPELIGLDLSYNSINDISVLEEVNFPMMRFLNIRDNNVNDISSLVHLNFPLEELNLSSNYLDISNGSEAMRIISNLKKRIPIINYDSQKVPPTEPPIIVPDPVSVNLSLTDGTVPQGENVTVTLRKTNANAIMAYNLSFKYDPAIFTPVSVQNLAGGMFEQNTAEPGKINATWLGGGNLAGEADLLSITFKVGWNVPRGNTTVSILPGGSVTDYDTNKMTVVPDNAKIFIETTVFGDVYEDGVIDIKDLQKLMSYIAGNVDLSPSEKLNADCYPDGVIDILDLVRLGRYINEGEVSGIILGKR